MKDQLFDIKWRISGECLDHIIINVSENVENYIDNALEIPKFPWTSIFGPPTTQVRGGA